VTPSLSWSIVSPITVGRSPLLASLDGLLGQAIAGTGRTVLLAGDAGIGKTRLAEEAKRRARECGMAIHHRSGVLSGPGQHAGRAGAQPAGQPVPFEARQVYGAE
jgi:hypothetical protein